MEERAQVVELLRRYIAHVKDCEGVDFLDWEGYCKTLTAEELALLRQIRNGEGT